INPVPHVSFAQGEIQVDYLKRRFEMLKDNHLFPGMEISDDREVFNEHLPLMGRGRSEDSKVAISWINIGTDVNLDDMPKQFLSAARAAGNEIRYGHEVTTIKRDGAGLKVYTKNVHTGDTQIVNAKFVFVGAGGYALDLLRKAGVREVAGYA